MEARAGAAPRQLTNYDGIHSSAGRGRPDWSKDGTRLAYTQSSGAKLHAYNMNRLAVVGVSGGEPKILTEGLDRSVAAPRFTEDGKSVFFLVADDRWEYPAVVPAGGGQVERLTKGPGVINTIEQGKDGRFVVSAAGDATHGEIYAFESGKLRPLTHHNDALVGQLRLGATEEFSCKAKDGNEVHGLMTKPPDYQSGKKYPTL
jgi:dipeptidyl aminopeptidase/acylaminoacyl peptidase